MVFPSMHLHTSHHGRTPSRPRPPGDLLRRARQVAGPQGGSFRGEAAGKRTLIAKEHVFSVYCLASYPDKIQTP